MNQADLNKYFATHWQTNLDQYVYSGWGLINKIKPDETVLDVGCGLNPFKQLIPNLTGIDPAFAEADYQTTIEDFVTDTKFDVAFCLGSINFGTEEKILHQINCVIGILKPRSRIYWRCNPGFYDHGNDTCNMLNFYPWSVEKHIEFSDQFGFRLAEIRTDTFKRIYAEWKKT
jgi:hypothetical protein